MYLAKNLRYLREQKGYSQQEIGEIFGVGQKTVSTWELECKTPGIKTIIRLAEHFEVTLDELVLQELRPPIPKYVDNIRYLRISHRITQEQMAELLGLKNKSSLSLIESGKSGISVENLEKIADFFGVTLDQLVKQDLSKEVLDEKK